MKISVCKTEMEFPGEVGELRSSNDIMGDVEALRDRVEGDGYLLLRNFHDRDDVLAAKARFQSEIQKAETDRTQLDLDCLAHENAFLKIFESRRLFDLFERYFNEHALTFDHKWLRAIAPGEYTGLHFDNVYMGRGSNQVHTVWNPIGDIDPDLGTLVVNVGSRRERKKRLTESYGMIDVDRDNMDGWYSHDPREYTEKYGGQWQTANVKAGDIIIITMFTMHCSTLNVTDGNRYSCDIRFQPASDPTDERWYGKDRSGHTDYGSGKSMNEFKKEYRI
ncbi:MAG: phytanoyl-CoA dioxygenase [Verrucomicrobia bacterium]|nr:MAG: phytanoyl-CoA dioxygenase [Verrucomicrobiota bacterium]